MQRDHDVDQPEPAHGSTGERVEQDVAHSRMRLEQPVRVPERGPGGDDQDEADEKRAQNRKKLGQSRKSLDSSAQLAHLVGHVSEAGILAVELGEDLERPRGVPAGFQSVR